MTSVALTELPSRTIPQIRRSVSLRTGLFSLTWILIIVAASYDAYFAWHYRAVLDAWEMNPFILWLAGVGGLASVFCSSSSPWSFHPRGDPLSLSPASLGDSLHTDGGG